MVLLKFVAVKVSNVAHGRASCFQYVQVLEHVCIFL